MSTGDSCCFKKKKWKIHLSSSWDKILQKNTNLLCLHQQMGIYSSGFLFAPEGGDFLY